MTTDPATEIIRMRRILRMVDMHSFNALFWEEVQAATRADPGTKKCDIFNRLNEEYYNEIGKLRFSDYESFRVTMTKYSTK